ncbi:MAG: AMP-dependent synthetase [Acidimicrobiaceae bacterium]|jgi:fatty-acyl-CoA synthase|nr:AMP-dependent synthetase [Acidimicrobiaceae bacterium]|tara:strand:- start:6759 stop:8426 length:1668 start_codon:yes stop_codon:yes gene_type:complete
MTKNNNWINVTSLGDLMDRQADKYGDKDAIIFPEGRYTYRDIATYAQNISKALLALGVGPGDRVGYFLQECIDTIGIIIGAAKIGAITAPINSRFKTTELKQVIVHAGMKVIFTSSPEVGTDFNGLINETFPQIATSSSKYLDFPEAPELDALVTLDEINRPGTFNLTDMEELGNTISDESVAKSQEGVRVRDTAIIMYTSGTTAMPKGAMLSHESFNRYASSVKQRMQLTENDIFWAALPMFHIGGVAFVLASLFVGSTFIHTGNYNPDVALQQIRDERPTVMLPAFETIWVPIVNHPNREEDDFDSVRIVMVVGVPERLRQFQSQTPHAPILNCFGQTEVCAFLSLSELDDEPELRFNKGGFPMPGMEAEVHDPDTGELLPNGNVGELWYRGPNMFDGYFRDPELTSEVFDERGFFRTGDICEIDADGRITFVSRLKDMLKVGGENVSAAEVEGYLITHPAIALAQVVSAPDERYVEVPAAYIELKPDTQATEEEIIAFCKGKIATYRIPRYVRFINEWPMSGTKIKKIVLREMIASELKSKGITQAEKISSS